MPALWEKYFDEVDKADKETRAILLGLMQSGEIIETKSKKTRGIVLNTQVFGACNKWDMFTEEFLSRFAFKPLFPDYTRQEFIEVCISYLGRAEGCPPDIAQFIGELVYDNQMGDVRQGRGVWQMMTAPTVSEVYRVIDLKIKYNDLVDTRSAKVKKVQQALL